MSDRDILERMATLRNTLTGAVGEYPDHVVDNHALFSPDVFVKAENGAKPYVAALYKPKTADEYNAQHANQDEADVESKDTKEDED